MPIALDCPCGRRLRVPDDFAGKNARCPACKGALAVPALAAGQFEVIDDEPPVVRPVARQPVPADADEDGNPTPRRRKRKTRRPADEEGPTARAYMCEAEARLRRDDESERTRKREQGDGYTFAGVHVTAGVVAGATLLLAGLVAIAVLLALRADGRPGSPRLYAVAAIGTILGALTLVKALVFGEED